MCRRQRSVMCWCRAQSGMLGLKAEVHWDLKVPSLLWVQKYVYNVHRSCVDPLNSQEWPSCPASSYASGHGRPAAGGRRWHPHRGHWPQLQLWAVKAFGQHKPWATCWGHHQGFRASHWGRLVRVIWHVIDLLEYHRNVKSFNQPPISVSAGIDSKSINTSISHMKISDINLIPGFCP